MEDAEEVNLGAGEEEMAGADGFEPIEDELVLHFARVAGVVWEADPCDAAPWDQLARHSLQKRQLLRGARMPEPPVGPPLAPLFWRAREPGCIAPPASVGL